VNKEAFERKKNSMKMWICNHYAGSSKYSGSDSKFYYLFPSDSHIERSLENKDPQSGRVGVFLHDGEKVTVGYASFFDHGGEDSFPDQDEWTEWTKFEGVQIWKLLVNAGSHYHFNPQTSVHCAGHPSKSTTQMRTQSSQYALEA